MTRADVVVGLAFGLAGAGLLLVWCLLRIAARADRDAPRPPAQPDGVLETWLDRSRPAPAAEVVEEPIRLLQRLDPDGVVDPTARAPYDHDHGARLLDEIERVLADVAAAAPVELVAPRLHAVRDVPAGECCGDHDAPVCRRFAPCCGACPTLPVS